MPPALAWKKPQCSPSGSQFRPKRIFSAAQDAGATASNERASKIPQDLLMAAGAGMGGSFAAQRSGTDWQQ
jgi:hypothetical protein